MLRANVTRRITAATLGLACLLAAAASQARVLVDQTRVCSIRQNEIGHDEIYLKFNGVNLHHGSFASGTCRDGSLNAIVSSLPVTVQLWESDGNHWYDPDDLWDSWSAGAFDTWDRFVSAGGFAYHYFFRLSFTP